MKDAEQDILLRATYLLLDIKVHGDPKKKFFKDHRFQLAQPQKSGQSRYTYEHRAEDHQLERTRYLIDHIAKYSSLVIAEFTTRYQKITLFEGGDMITRIPDMRIILNLIERQAYELLPGIKVERLTRTPKLPNMRYADSGGAFDEDY